MSEHTRCDSLHVKLCLYAVPSCCAYMLIPFSSYLSYSHPQTSTLHTCLNTQPLVPPLISPVTNTVVLNSDTPPLTSSSTHPVTHPVTHSVTHTLTHSLTLSHTPSHTQPVTHPLTLSHSHLHSHIHTLSHSRTHTFSHTPSYTHLHSHLLSHTPSPTFSHAPYSTPSFTLSHTLTHLLSCPLALSPSHTPVSPTTQRIPLTIYTIDTTGKPTIAYDFQQMEDVLKAVTSLPSFGKVTTTSSISIQCPIIRHNNDGSRTDRQTKANQTIH